MACQIFGSESSLEMKRWREAALSQCRKGKYYEQLISEGYEPLTLEWKLAARKLKNNSRPKKGYRKTWKRRVIEVKTDLSLPKGMQ